MTTFQKARMIFWNVVFYYLMAQCVYVLVTDDAPSDTFIAAGVLLALAGLVQPWAKIPKK